MHEILWNLHKITYQYILCFLCLLALFYSVCIYIINLHLFGRVSTCSFMEVHFMYKMIFTIIGKEQEKSKRNLFTRTEFPATVQKYSYLRGQYQIFFSSCFSFLLLDEMKQRCPLNCCSYAKDLNINFWRHPQHKFISMKNWLSSFQSCYFYEWKS